MLVMRGAVNARGRPGHIKTLGHFLLDIREELKGKLRRKLKEKAFIFITAWNVTAEMPVAQGAPQMQQIIIFLSGIILLTRKHGFTCHITLVRMLSRGPSLQLCSMAEVGH